jgi:hypothetical protein
MLGQRCLLSIGITGLLLLGGYSKLAITAPRPNVLSADPHCNPVQATCTAGNGDMIMALRLQGDVRPLHRFSVQVSLGGSVATAVEQVSVRFDMVGMDMGENRFQLSRQAESVWQGQALLPACSQGGRDWRATVEVAGEALYTAEFNLRVGD